MVSWVKNRDPRGGVHKVAVRIEDRNQMKLNTLYNAIRFSPPLPPRPAHLTLFIYTHLRVNAPLQQVRTVSLLRPIRDKRTACMD